MKFIKHFWCQKVLPLVYDDSLSYYEILCKLKTKINEIIGNINKLNEQINSVDLPTEIINQLATNRILNTKTSNSIRYYVSLYGDDNNDGLSDNSPMKTLDKCIQKASLWYNDIRIQIITEGVYDTEWLTFTGGALHINAKVPNVIIKSKTNIAFYDTHLNITGVDKENPIIILIDSPDHLLYLDGGSLSSHYVDYQCILRTNGCWGGGAGCVFRNVYVHGNFFTFVGSDNVFKNKKVTSEPALHIYNGSVLTSGSLNVELSSDESGDFIFMRGGTFDLNTDIVVKNKYKYVGNVDINHGSFLTNASAKKSLNNAIKGDVIVLPITLSNLKTPHLIELDTVTPSTDSYTTLTNIDLPAGFWIVRIAIIVAGGSNVFGNIRLRNPNYTGYQYKSCNFISGKNNFDELITFVSSTNDIQMELSAQYFKDVPLQIKVYYTEL